jgi:hypothetical protein
MNDPTTLDTDDIEGFAATPATTLQGMSAEEIYDRLDETGYVDDYGTNYFMDTQMEGLSDWWSESVFQENQQRMEEGEIPMTSMYSPFFTFHHGNDRRINPASQTPMRYWTVDRDLGNTQAMGPLQARYHRDIEDTINMYDRDFDWLAQQGVRQETIDQVEEMVREEAMGRERYDGGWAYWTQSNQRRPRDHPMYDEMLQEMIEQTMGGDDELTEMSDGTFTGEMSEFLTDDNYLNGYYTTEEDMREMLEEARQLVNDQDNKKEQFLANLPVAAPQEIPVGEVSTDDPTEDLIALPSARIPLEDKIRMNRDIINP